MSSTFVPGKLKKLPTLCTAQCCDLKIESAKQRVWLCRVNHGVTVERYDAPSGRWEIYAGSCSARAGVYL